MGHQRGKWKRKWETKNTTLQIRLTENQREGIMLVAEKKGVSASKLILEFIDIQMEQEGINPVTVYKNQMKIDM